jgi:1-acyl-sn-glycerol-3-phosphate acyltransferase
VYDDPAWIESSLEVIRLLEGCGARFHVEGLSALDRLKPPVVFMANHMSTLETNALPAMIAPRFPVTFVVKRSLTEHKIFGPTMRSRNPIVVDRINPRDDLKAVMEQGCERLAAGMSVIVFPQGTRFPAFEVSRFNTLALKLAQKAGVPLVPIALRSDFWTNGRLFKDLGPLRRRRPVHFAFGEAIDTSTPGRTAHEAALAFLKTKLLSWGVPFIEA